LVDSSGVLSPHAMKYFVSFLLGRIFGGEPVPTPGSSPGASFAGKCSKSSHP
jgi:hypothetical protein